MEGKHPQLLAPLGLCSRTSRCCLSSPCRRTRARHSIGSLHNISGSFRARRCLSARPVLLPHHTWKHPLPKPTSHTCWTSFTKHLFQTHPAGLQTNFKRLEGTFSSLFFLFASANAFPIAPPLPSNPIADLVFCIFTPPSDQPLNKTWRFLFPSPPPLFHHRLEMNVASINYSEC